jgi:hypothetical protein
MMNNLVVSNVGGHLFVRKRGIVAGWKALWFVLTHYPVAFMLLLDAAIYTHTNPGTVALFFVIEMLPEWKRTGIANE